MNAKYTLFRRGGIYYSQDSATGQQKSLRTRDEAGALKLINARNEAHPQPVLTRGKFTRMFGWRLSHG
jgi:hypothetical protein